MEWGGALGWTAEQTLRTPMPQIDLMHAGRIALITETLHAIYGKPDEAGAKKADLDLDDKTTLVSAKNSTATLAIMRSIAAKAAAVFSKPAPADAPSSIFTPPAES